MCFMIDFENKLEDLLSNEKKETISTEDSDLTNHNEKTSDKNEKKVNSDHAPWNGIIMVILLTISLKICLIKILNLYHKLQKILGIRNVSFQKFSLSM